MKADIKHNEPPASELAQTWLNLKATEERAYRERMKVEQQLLDYVETKDEGSKTTTLPDGTKITVTGRINRSLDFKAFEQIRDLFPAELMPTKLVEQVDDGAVRELRENWPDLYRHLVPCLTSKPGKPTFKVAAPLQEAS